VSRKAKHVLFYGGTTLNIIIFFSRMKPRKQLEISLTGPAIVERFRGTALDFFSSAGSHSASASSCLSSRLFSVFFPVVLNGFAVFQSGSPRQFCISVFAKDCHRILGQFSISLFFVNRPPPSCLRLPFSLLFLCFITLFHRVSLAISPKKKHGNLSLGRV